MTLNKYQSLASETDLGNPEDYYIHGLSSEAGEVAAVRKRQLRGDDEPGSMLHELGDVLWYVAMVAQKYDYDLDTIAQANVEKLQSRKARHVVAGTGDNR